MLRKAGRRQWCAGGFTLIELMMGVMIFTIAAVSLMGVYVGVAQLNESNRNLTRAMADARFVLEGIRDTSTAGLSSVTSTNWTTWATQNDLTSLGSEAVAVTYVNQAADPLQVHVQVSWQERSRAKSVEVDTLVTRR